MVRRRVVPTVIAWLGGRTSLFGRRNNRFNSVAVAAVPTGFSTVDVPEPPPAKKALVIVTQDRNFVNRRQREQVAIRSALLRVSVLKLRWLLT